MLHTIESGIRFACFRVSFLYWIVLTAFLAGCAGDRSSERSLPEEETAAREKEASPEEEKTILFFGNSLTAGYGLDTSQAFPALIQRKIDSLGLSYRVINAGLSGETSASGKNRIDWFLRQPVDIFVLELGANDGLRGIPVTETAENLQAITDRVTGKYPDARLVLAGMQVPPNMGTRYTGEFREVFPRLAEENGMVLIPFLLEGVGGEQELNQEDGIHPTAQGHRIVAENVWDVLKDLL